MAEGFNITNLSKPVNDTLVITFSPSQNVSFYTYTVYKNNAKEKESTINSNKNVQIILKDTGNYFINVRTTDKQNQTKDYTGGVYVVDKEAPVIEAEENITIKKSKDFNPVVTATDNLEGNITSKITSNQSTINLDEKGIHQITYTVYDNAGNIAEKTINVTTVNQQSIMFFLCIIMIAAVLLIHLITNFIKTIKLSKRLESFTISSKKENETSLFDDMIGSYRNIIDKINKPFEKSVIFTKYAKRLDKYGMISTLHNTGMQILCGKFICSILFMIITIIAKTLRLEVVQSYDLLIPVLLGFFTLDIIYIVKYKYNKAKLENDFLSAITIMNNAFKAGRSISQAIDIVSEELEGPMGEEFRKMSLELTYGLGIDVIFKRFSERIRLEEVNYLTASLTILNKTGGNITEVFNSIEKSLFNKKKLRLELKTLTASSRIIVYVIIAVPLLFILFVNIINPGYFDPFITTKIGNILGIFIVLFYSIFIYCVRKIMKVVI